MMVFNKKGQGLSLNVIIVAALALIVLVVLVAVFAGEVGDKTDKINKASQAELVKLQITYGQCQPATSDQNTFLEAYSVAESDGDKDVAVADFEKKISDCKALSDDKATCDTAGCKWK